MVGPELEFPQGPDEGCHEQRGRRDRADGEHSARDERRADRENEDGGREHEEEEPEEVGRPHECGVAFEAPELEDRGLEGSQPHGPHAERVDRVGALVGLDAQAREPRPAGADRPRGGDGPREVPAGREDDDREDDDEDREERGRGERECTDDDDESRGDHEEAVGAALDDVAEAPHVVTRAPEEVARVRGLDDREREGGGARHHIVADGREDLLAEDDASVLRAPRRDDRDEDRARDEDEPLRVGEDVAPGGEGVDARPTMSGIAATTPVARSWTRTTRASSPLWSAPSEAR